ncbi:hypothetical protein [Maribellus sediminis]|uniref:hypothetical protein n=1 Tax=Maribellus sediminis TaxID=2696285 RepID=UPI00142F756B|nr:hypothetical protein [Maribellus sediminis]
MKLRKILWIGILLMPIFACDEVNDQAETSAELNVPITLEAVMVENTFSTTSPFDLYSFNGLNTFCLANKDNVKNCPGLVVGVTPGVGAKLHFDGIGDNQHIQSLQLEWGYGTAGKYEFEMQPPIQLLSDGELLTPDKLTVDIDQVMAALIQKMDENPRFFIVVKLSGYSNFDVSFDAVMKVPVVVKSEDISAGFTL